MDRHLAGVLAICIVISTIATVMIVGESAAGVDTVENRFPRAVYFSREKGVFTFHRGMVAREDFEHLEILMYSLERRAGDPGLEEQQINLESLAEQIPSIAMLRGLAESLGGEPLLLKIGVGQGNFTGTLHILDFSPVFDAFAPRGVPSFPEGARAGILASPGCRTAFGFLFDESGGFVSAYSGVRDFFLDRELTLSDLYVRRNDQTTSYTSTRMANQPEGTRLLDAPWGRLTFSEVQRDDRFEVGFSVNAAWLRGSPRIIQVAAVFGDLKEVLFQANLIGT